MHYCRCPCAHALPFRSVGACDIFDIGVVVLCTGPGIRYGSTHLYAFIRLHHAIFNRLRAAKALCAEASGNREGIIAHAMHVAMQNAQGAGGHKEVDFSKFTPPSYGATTYQVLLGLVIASVDGTTESASK